VEYQEMFSRFFNNFEYYNHSALGIGILPGDIKYAKGLRNKMIIGLSRTLTGMVDILKPLKQYSDSIYIKSFKNNNAVENSGDQVEKFIKAHELNPRNNLNIVPLLSCPVSGKSFKISSDNSELICQEAGLTYPVKNNIPILVQSESRTL